MFEDLVQEKRDQMYMVRMSKTTKGYLLGKARQIGTDGATLLDRMVRQFMQWEGSDVKTHTGTPDNNDAQSSYNFTYDNEASQAVQTQAVTPIKRARKPRTQNAGAKSKSKAKPGRKPKAASTNTKKVTKTRGRPKVSA